MFIWPKLRKLRRRSQRPARPQREADPVLAELRARLGLPPAPRTVGRRPVGPASA